LPVKATTHGSGTVVARFAGDVVAATGPVAAWRQPGERAMNRTIVVLVVAIGCGVVLADQPEKSKSDVQPAVVEQLGRVVPVVGDRLTISQGKRGEKTLEVDRSVRITVDGKAVELKALAADMSVVIE
jgi:hypothetical protein